MSEIKTVPGTKNKVDTVHIMIALWSYKYCKHIELLSNGQKIKSRYQALQCNFIDGFSFRDEKETGSSSTTQPTEQGPEGLTAVHTQHTIQTDLQGPHLYLHLCYRR